MLGQRLMTGLREATRQTGHSLLVQGPGPIFHVGFTAKAKVADYWDTFAYDKAAYAQFALAMQERGIRLIGRGLWYLSAAHTEAAIAHCLAKAQEAL